MATNLETPKQLAERVGVPVHSIRYLIREDMLDHIFTAPGKRNPKIPKGSWEKYIAEFTIRSCSSPAAKGNLNSLVGGSDGHN